MTKYHDVDITCPYCGRTGPFRIYDSINTVLDPELKEALFDFSLFTFTCPVCQKKHRSYIPCSITRWKTG